MKSATVRPHMPELPPFIATTIKTPVSHFFLLRGLAENPKTAALSHDFALLTFAQFKRRLAHRKG